MKILRFSNSEEGQALVELMAVIIICTFLGVGIYEAGAFFHNISVMNTAMETAAKYASKGASMEAIRGVIDQEAVNLLGGAFLEQHVLRPDNPDASPLIVEIWNPRTNEPMVTEYTEHQEKFEPGVQNLAPYMFWAEGYEIRVGVYYAIGIHVPYIRSFTIDLPITASRVITAPNDTDRDGMMDSQEVEYLGWWLDEQNKDWGHPVHRDDYDTMDTTDGAEIDGDSVVEKVSDCNLKITRVCGGAANLDCGNENYIEVYNPGPVSYTLDKIRVCAWTGAACSPKNISLSGSNRELSPGEYYILASADISGVDEDQTDNTLVFNNSSDGVYIENKDGVKCDAVGYGGIGNSDYYEKSTVSLGSQEATENPELERTNLSQYNQIIDSGNNENDFTDQDSSLNTRSSYERYWEYDFNNNAIEDKFDPDDGSDTDENKLNGNPIIGPRGWADTAPL